MRAVLTHIMTGRQGKLLYAEPLPKPVTMNRCVLVEALWPTHERANAIVTWGRRDYLAFVATLPPFAAVMLHLTPSVGGPIACLDLLRPGQPYPRRGELPREGAEVARDALVEPRLLGVLLDWLSDHADRILWLSAGDVRQAADEVRRVGRFFSSPPRRKRR